MAPELAYIDFWEMGQADCSVLHFSDKSIIVIDVGRKGTPLVDWLRNWPRNIRAVVLTHNDADHVGGLCGLVAEQKSQIGAIYLLQDRPKQDPAFQKLFRCALDGEKAGYYKMTWLEAGKVVWESADNRTRLIVAHPSFSEFVENDTPNTICAMLALEHDQQVLALWTGDLLIQQVAAKFTGRPPWLMTGPHHGAPSDYRKKPEAVNAVNSLSPKRSFLSVGTTNPFHHPRPRYVLSVAKTGCQVVCSQLTRWCDTAHLQTKKPVFPGTAMLGLPSPRGGGIPCRGAWRVLFQNNKLISDQHDIEHLSRVAQLRRPLCLRGRGWIHGMSPLTPVS